MLTQICGLNHSTTKVSSLAFVREIKSTNISSMDEIDEKGESSFGTQVREMAHEMRSPLTSIMGFAELLLEDESLTGQTREYLQVISDESRRLSSVLNHYLSVLLVDSEQD
jgi:signal transduction histidine kinase